MNSRFKTVIAERKIGFYIANKIPYRRGKFMADAIIKKLSQLPKGAVKTIHVTETENSLVGER